MRNGPLTTLHAPILVKLGLVSLGLVSTGLPALAHHSFAAEYDGSREISVTGTVTKVEWMNPHARFYLDVKGADGSVTNWNFELGPVTSSRGTVGQKTHSKSEMKSPWLQTQRKTPRNPPTRGLSSLATAEGCSLGRRLRMPTSSRNDCRASSRRWRFISELASLAGH